jgi:NADP-dependent 3-hydroxy acid dehydrogenase YdfG
MSAATNKKTVIVTGASSGIGQGIAIGFGQQGANVVVNYHRDEQGANETLDRIKAAGGSGFIHQADVSDEGEVEEMFRKTEAEYGRIDVLINNAGIQQDSDFASMSLEQWDKVIHTNLTGQFLCARAAIRHFEQQAQAGLEEMAKGNIIFMSSVHDIIPWAGHVNYASLFNRVRNFCCCGRMRCSPLTGLVGVNTTLNTPGDGHTEYTSECRFQVESRFDDQGKYSWNFGDVQCHDHYSHEDVGTCHERHHDFGNLTNTFHTAEYD